jgi:MYXO-CTERM domain-containing protein
MGRMRLRSALLIARVTLVASAAFTSLALPALERDARADIVEPNTHRVEYSFSIENAKDYPDWVFLAYPYSMSFGAPTTETTRVTELPSQIGRWQEPTIYAMKKKDFESERPTSLLGDDLEPLFKSKKVLASKVKILAVHRAHDDSPVEAIHDIITIDKLDAQVFEARIRAVFKLKGGAKEEVAFPADGSRPEPSGGKKAKAGPGPSPAEAPAEPALALDSPSPTAPSTSSAPPAATPSSRGCGCATAAATGSSGVVLLGAMLLAWKLRRRSSSRASRRPGER